METDYAGQADYYVRFLPARIRLIRTIRVLFSEPFAFIAGKNIEMLFF